MKIATAWKTDASAWVGRAILAPSSHNTQPWRFAVSDESINLFADRMRALPVNDPDDRELTISCGAALYNLRGAMAAAGQALRVELLPDSNDPDWLARVAPDCDGQPSAADALLAESIEVRRTWRKQFSPSPVEQGDVDLLIEAAAAEGCWLKPVLDEDERQTMGHWVAEGDAVQWANPSWRRELAAWMHPRRQGDGLTVPGLIAPVAKFVVRTFEMGAGIGAKDRELADGSPLLAVLGTNRDDPRAWIMAGQALERVLLTGCQSGLQASYLNQPVQVPALRAKVQHLVGGGFPQILLRIGYPTGVLPATPRRHLRDVLETQS